MSRQFTPEQKEARLAATRRWRARNPEKAKAAALAWKQANPEKYKESVTRWYWKLKAEVFAAYGGKCQCCGEPNPGFLTLDHAQNQGAEHRRTLKNGGTGMVFRAVKEAGFPKDLYQLLCWNCNCGRAMNGGVCPHKESTSP